MSKHLTPYLQQLEQELNMNSMSAFTQSQLQTIRNEANRQGISVEQFLSNNANQVMTPAVSTPSTDQQYVSGGGVDGVANIEFYMTRTSQAGTTANLGDLPAIIGFPNNRDNDYQRLFSQFLTTQGLTLAVARVGNDLGLTFSNGVDTDLVTIGCRDQAMNTVITGLIATTLFANMMRYTVPSGTLQQLNQPINFVKDTIFGLRTSNPLIPGKYSDPKNNQANIVDISQGAILGNQTGLIASLSSAVTGQGEVSLNLFVGGYNRPKY